MMIHEKVHFVNGNVSIDAFELEQGVALISD